MASFSPEKGTQNFTQVQTAEEITKTLNPEENGSLTTTWPTDQIQDLTALESEPLMITQGTCGMETQPDLPSTPEKNPMEVVITGKEIQPYVPAAGTKESTQIEPLQEITNIIRQKLHRVKTELKDATPMQQQQPQIRNAVIHVPEIEQTPLRKQRERATKVAEVEISFEIPEHCAKVLEGMEETRTAAADSQKMPLVPFSERFSGWVIERRRRADGRFDLYYHHEASVIIFRSISEVIGFVLHNAYPKNHITKKRRLEHNSLVDGSGTSVGRAEATPSARQKKLKTPMTQKEIVEKFLRDSFNNFQNSNVDKSYIFQFCDSESKESDGEEISLYNLDDIVFPNSFNI